MSAFGNNVFLMGRITRDLEIRRLATGQAVLNFTIAIDKPFSKEKGERGTNFIECAAWGKTAENIAAYFKKGHRIGIIGSLETSVYEDKDGKKRKNTSVVVDNFGFIEAKGANSQPINMPTGDTAAESTVTSEDIISDNEGDLPF